MTAWTATWGPGPGWLRWQLTITDEAGNVALVERSKALYGSPRPDDRLLESMGLQLTGEWERGEDGAFSRPVARTTPRLADKLAQGLLAGGRSDPGSRAGAHGGR